MKCSNCGHELEPGSGFCENCGMITSLDSEESKPGTSSDVYSGEPYDSEKQQETVQQSVDGGEETAAENAPRELEADATEQIVPVFEYPEEKEPVSQPQKTEFIDNSDIYVDDSLSEKSEFEEDDDAPEKEDEDVPAQSDEDEDADSGYEAPESGDGSESEDDEEADEDGLDDMYVTSSKSKRNSILIAVLIVVLIAVSAGGAVMIKDNFSKVPVNAPTADTQGTSVPKESATTNKAEPDDSETSEDVTDDETTEDEETTEKETTEKESTEKEQQDVTEPSEENTTKKPSETEEKTTTKQTTTKSTTTTKKYTTTQRPSGTKPITTKPATTKPVTTKPTTTKPTTTKPTTTKPTTTTDPYGFGTDTVQKPDSYLAAGSRYTVYVSVNSLNMRSKPSADSSRVVYVSLGEDLTVYGKRQNGFLYVRSNRYGVYGWVAESYVSKTRPKAEETVVVPGIVKPDKTYSSPKTMYVNAKVGIRLRKAPDTDAASVRTLSYGFPVKVTGYSSEHSGWVYVTDTTHGVTGWTRLEWLAKNQ